MENTKYRFKRSLSILLAFSISLFLFSGVMKVNANQNPPPNPPSYVYVEAVDSDTIKLEWAGIPEVNYYEIYATSSSNANTYNNYIYVGSVMAQEISQGNLRYYVDGLNASTWYSFKLKSVNDNGLSAFSYQTSHVITKSKKITNSYQLTGNYFSGIAQKDITNILGSSVTVIAGENSLGNYKSGLILNLNSKDYMNYNPKNVDLGIDILRTYPNNFITIEEKDFVLKMQSKNLLVKETNTVSHGELTDSKMTITVVKDLKAKGDEIKLKVPKSYKALTAPVEINLTMQLEDTKTNIKTFNGSANISFNISDANKKQYAGGIYIAYYNNENVRLESVSAKIVDKTIEAQITRPGEYILLGKLSK